MEFSGTQTIAAPRDVVWAALNDPAVLQACVPGCESFSARSEDEYEAVVQAAVGPVKARFKGSLTLSERRANEGYRIAGKGEGGIAGFGKMQAVVTLADAPEGWWHGADLRRHGGRGRQAGPGGIAPGGVGGQPHGRRILQALQRAVGAAGRSRRHAG
jgi:carbon monoxide dehydrogenase subunit G